MKQILPRHLKEWLDDPQRNKPILIDVRPAEEFSYCSIPGSISIPFDDIPEMFDKFDYNYDIVLICHSFDRSISAAIFLERKGFTSVTVLLGGIDAWSLRVDPSIPRYK